MILLAEVLPRVRLKDGKGATGTITEMGGEGVLQWASVYWGTSDGKAFYRTYKMSELEIL